VRGLVVSSIVLAIGCEKTLPIEVGGIDFDYGFFVTYPAEGEEPIRISSTFGVEDGAIVFGDPPALVLGDDEERFLFVAMDAEDLHPSFERARASELQAILEKPPDIELDLEGVGVTNLIAKTRLPERARILTADLDEAGEGLGPATELAPFDDVTLRMPVEPEHCRIQDLPPFAPFAAVPMPFPRSPYTPIVKIRYLDRDRVIVANRGYVYVVERGGTITSTETGPFWGIAEDTPWLPVDRIMDLAVGPPGEGADRSLVAVGGDPFTEPPIHGRIWPLRLSGGAIELEHASQVLDEADVGCIPTPERECDLRVQAAAFTPDGRAWVGATDGAVFTRSSTATRFTRIDQLRHRTDDPDGIIEMTPIDAGGFFMMVGLKNHLYLLREDGRREEQFLMRSGILGPVPLRFGALAAIHAPGEEPDYWAAGFRGELARKRGERSWTLLSEAEQELRYPPRFAACASSDDPEGNPLGFNKEITAILAFEGYVYMGHTDCNAIVMVRRSDQCVSLAPIYGEEVVFSTAYITAMDRLERRLIVGTSGGQIYEIVLP
jgi:hypothetical protein